MRFFSWLAGSVKPQTSDVYFNGIRSFFLHMSEGKLDLQEHFWVLNRVRMGIRRCFSSSPRQAAPVLPVHLERIYSSLNLAVEQDARDWTLFITAFAGFLRRSEVASLTRADISFDTGCVRLRILRSKTSDTPSTVVLGQRTDKRFCPVFWLTHWLARTLQGALPSHSLFAISKQQVGNRLRHWLDRNGVPTGEFSGHSLRRGGASAAAAAHVPEHLIKLHGRWKSDAYLQYLVPTRDEVLSVSTFPLLH